MSHIVELDIRINNVALFGKIAEMLGHEIVGPGEHYIFGQKPTGFGINLKGWSYPIVVKDDGTLVYDNYHGGWGNLGVLDNLVQQYAKALTLLQARAAGRNVTEQTMPDGTIVLRISLES